MSSTLFNIGTMLAERDGDGPGTWWPVFPILWLLIFLSVLFLVSRRARACGNGTRSGVARLSERFAAGEIDEAEYRERLAVLKEGRR